jgi:hypothetical protein
VRCFEDSASNFQNTLNGQLDVPQVSLDETVKAVLEIGYSFRENIATEFSECGGRQP